MKYILLFFFLSSEIALAGEKNLYDFVWLDQDKKVYVLQNKLFRKEKSFFADVGYISNDSSKFQDTRGIQARTGWYFHEEWGIEGFYNHYMNSNNDDFKNIQVVNSQVPFVRRLNSSYGLLVVWSPFYGKINTFNNIYYFDWSFGAGITSINAESNLKTFNISTNVLDYKKESLNGAVLRTSVKFHIRENIHLFLTYFNTLYKAASPKNPDNEKLKFNTDIILGLGFSL